MTVAIWPLIVSSGRGYPSYVTDDEDFVGGKGAGLLRLPREWVPPFFVLTKAFCERARIRGASSAFKELSQDDAGVVTEFLARDAELTSPTLLVRSNAANEDVSARGAFLSVAALSMRDAVAAAVEEVLSSGDEGMRVIVQRAVQPAIPGHMSNERRVSHRASTWLVEGLPSDGRGAFGHTISATPGSKARPPAPAPLMARSEKEVLSRLREVAAFAITIEPRRFHCEWVWDARRLWIVQCDRASIDESRQTLEELLGKHEAPAPFAGNAEVKHFSKEPDRWQKLRRPRVFRELGIPVADVFVLTGAAWTQPERRTKAIEALSDMCAAGTVVLRSDVSNESGRADLLLPTSPATREVAQLVQFGDELTSRFAKEDVAPADWAILPAFLVPAQASAMVHARPKAERVRVDALWGFPDGLSYFPHDSWFYYPNDKRTEERTRYKGNCVVPDGAGWRACSIGAPQDWASTLEESEVQTVADWGLRLADKLGSEVQLMALARIGGRRGPEGCLPWHYTHWGVPRYRDSVRMLPPVALLETIRSRDDLARLRNRSVRPEVRGLFVRPEAALLRDDEFLTSAAALARDVDRPIYFEGSLLGHAYYVMARAGAVVVPVNDAEPAESEKTYNKLVRDKIPLIVQAAGGLARVRPVDHSEARALLRQKLVEEAFEALSCPEGELVDELADVLEVVDALCRASGIEEGDLTRVREEKRAKRGGFEQGIYLEATAIQPLRIGTDQEGRLPLVDVEDSVPSAERRAKAPVQVEVLPAQSGERVRLRVSLIPPAFDSAATATFVLPALDAKISIAYDGKAAEITLADHVAPSTSKQLTLFPEATADEPSDERNGDE